MIKKSFFAIALFFLVGISVFYSVADAYWIWTPETKKFTNPKNAVKDSPKEQFEWAMTFYEAKDYQRAATEFEKLAKQYEFSEYASKAQYYVGLCYEDMNKYYIAYQNYQKAIDNFPHIANTEEILAREFAIANLYLSKPSPKVLGTDIMAPLDRAVEIFKKIVENAPYGKFADESQFKLGEALKKSERYEEAIQAFHKVVEDYPKSKFATQAMYEESNCAYKASLRPAYDAAATDNAIKTFEKFVHKNKDADMAKNADVTMKRLRDNIAEKSYRAAEFYESQGKTQAAIIYYQDVVDTYPDSAFAEKSKIKIEALKNKGTKKPAVSVIDFSKKKSKRVVKEKKPWSPFSFKSQKPKEKTETSVSDTVKKKSWNPFSLKREKPQKKAEASVSDIPKTKSWSPLSFMGGKKTKPAEKKAWKPLSFNAAKKTEQEKATEAPVVSETPIASEAPVVPEAPAVSETAIASPVPQTPEPAKVEPSSQSVETPVAEAPAAETQTAKKEEMVSQVKETPKDRSWKPFNFGKKEVAPVKEPITKEPSKKSPWNIFNLGVKKEPVVKKPAEKKAWKPLSFNAAKKTEQEKATEAPVVSETPIASEAPVVPEAPAVSETAIASPVPQTPEPAKVEPSSQSVETPVAEAPVAETQTAKKEEMVSQVKETPKDRSWKPFNFEKKEDKAVEEPSRKKGWRPLSFGTNDNTMAVTDRRW